MSTIICSENSYTRSQAIDKIKSKSWYAKTSKEMKEKIEMIPEEFNGFINDLADRETENIYYKIEEMIDLIWDERYITPSFKVVSKRDGSDYANSYVAWRKGKYHSIRGLVLVETEGEVSHFLVRRSVRFAVDGMVSESMAGIYPPKGIQEDSIEYEIYIQEELKKTLRNKNFRVAKLINLGHIYPDVSMSDNVVKIFAAKIEVTDIDSFKKMVEGKIYNDKRYDYSFEIVPVDDLLKFLAETNDSFLLAIFGRLQALKVIRL